MSAARETAGIRSHSGRHCTRQDDPCLSKTEIETLRQSLADHERAHRLPRRDPDPADPPPRQRSRAGWQARFVRALARTGDMSRAADSSRASYSTARSAATRQPAFRAAIDGAISDWAARQLARCARLGGRWALSQRTAQALLRHFSNSTAAGAAA